MVRENRFDVNIQAIPGRGHISLAAMLLPTNDGMAVSQNMRVPVGRNSSTAWAFGYDAGSELNDELCDSIPGPRCEGAADSPDDESDEGYVHIHPGIQGVGDLTPGGLRLEEPGCSGDHQAHPTLTPTAVAPAGLAYRGNESFPRCAWPRVAGRAVSVPKHARLVAQIHRAPSYRELPPSEGRTGVRNHAEVVRVTPDTTVKRTGSGNGWGSTP